jgi:hypothetical protein
MPLITGGSSRGVPESWAISYPVCPAGQIHKVFYLSITHFVLRASIFLSYLQTKLTIMCMEHLRMKSYDTSHYLYNLSIITIITIITISDIIAIVFI